MQLERLEERCLLATFVVNSTLDDGDLNPGEGICEASPSGGVCTLRAAIQESNAFDDGGSDTINIAAGTYTLTQAGQNEDAAVTGDLDITADVTIQRSPGDLGTVIIQAGTLGPNDDTVGGGNGIDRVFDVPDLGNDMRVTNVNISDVTIQHGKAPTNGGGISYNTLGLFTLDGVTVTDNSSGLFGGGIFVRRGNMNVTDSAITNNRSTLDGGGIDAALSGPSVVNITDCSIIGNVSNSDGGGIFNDFGGAVTIRGTTISGNSAVRGGGIFNSGTANVLAATSVTMNTTSGLGGGINNFNGVLTVSDSVVSINMAGESGGGIFNDDGTTTITNSLVSANQAADDGGGIFTVNTGVTGTMVTIQSSTIANNQAGTDGSGGGIFNSGDSVMIDSSTLADNIAATEYGGGSGGGIFNDNGSVTIRNSTLSNNTAGDDGGGIFTRAIPDIDATLDVQDSVFFGNVAGVLTIGDGGAIYNDGDVVMLSNVTISGNSANGEGGGYYQGVAPSGSALLINVTITNNTAPVGSNIFTDGAGPVQLGNTIVSAGQGSANCNDGSLVTSFGHNLEDADSCGFGSTTDDGDLVNTDPVLGPLQNNGGSTNTHALCEAPGVPDASCQGTSPAIDAGDNDLSPTCPPTRLISAAPASGASRRPAARSTLARTKLNHSRAASSSRRLWTS